MREFSELRDMTKRAWMVVCLVFSRVLLTKESMVWAYEKWTYLTFAGERYDEILRSAQNDQACLDGYVSRV